MKYFNITVSGKICTGKSTLRNLLYKKLNWQTYSTGEIFREYVKNNRLNLEQADEQNEKLAKKIDNQVRILLKTKKYLIVDSWMAGIMAKNLPGILKVLLICKDEIRYKRFANREKVSYDEAKEKVNERYDNWVNKLEKIYNRNDFMDKKHFDIVIDTAYITPQAVMKKVMIELEDSRCG
ncbi:MAG: Cytidylate kinase [Candidatus Roizmanbacteria bacterium GW2011_GWA2_36_23]|uniref:Cytidylate kinase n=1 Tax=Candidatus Roizmanbacteria bacterium GW2011_GWA2_36_23 TaxID=1618480 RepID=A0A0G0GPR8_9BACT|nr:MAG: Cytidylate kinase [Candidatus Roizmanbacteria bacterium GW2011_GWA2_36_23]